MKALLHVLTSPLGTEKNAAHNLQLDPSQLEELCAMSFKERVQDRLYQLIDLDHPLKKVIDDFEPWGQSRNTIPKIRSGMERCFEIIDQFCRRNNINALHIKGKSIEDLYPLEYWRQSNDIDFAFSDLEEVFLVAKELISHGFHIAGHDPYLIFFPNIGKKSVIIKMLNEEMNVVVELQAGVFPTSSTAGIPVDKLIELSNPLVPYTHIYAVPIELGAVMFTAELRTRKRILLRDVFDWQVIASHIVKSQKLEQFIQYLKDYKLYDQMIRISSSTSNSHSDSRLIAAEIEARCTYVDRLSTNQFIGDCLTSVAIGSSWLNILYKQSEITMHKLYGRYKNIDQRIINFITRSVFGAGPKSKFGGFTFTVEINREAHEKTIIIGSKNKFLITPIGTFALLNTPHVSLDDLESNYNTEVSLYREVHL